MSSCDKFIMTMSSMTLPTPKLVKFQVSSEYYVIPSQCVQFSVILSVQRLVKSIHMEQDASTWLCAPHIIRHNMRKLFSRL